MIGKKNGGNFLTAHYDYLAAAIAVVALVAGVVMYVGSLGTDGEACAQERVTYLRRLTPGGEKTAGVDMTDFNKTLKDATNPKELPAVLDDRASYLASEARIVCTNCQALIVKDVTACPKCRVALEAVRPEVKDADGDGLPDDWEKKYFGSTAACEPGADADGDAFTNEEEYAAQTNPTDKTDHPDYFASLKLTLPLAETNLSFYCMGTMKTPAGLKFRFKSMLREKVEKDYDRGVYSVLANEPIGDSGYVATKLVPKTVERKIAGGMTRKEDVSEVVVMRKSDGKTLSLKVGKAERVVENVQAKLVYTRGSTRFFTVVIGDTIDLNGEKFVVKTITSKGKGASVTFADAKTGKVRELVAP